MRRAATRATTRGFRVFRRQREYYVGDRTRRGRGPIRLLIVIVAVLALAGGAALGGYLPALAAYLPALGSENLPAAASPTASIAPVALATVSPTTAPSPTPIPSATVQPGPSLPVPCAGPSGIAPARVLSHGDFNQKIVALTFDDGTNPDNTRQILHILQREKVNATFFPTGRALERFPDVWGAVAKASYPIANHTYSHGELKGKCFEAQARELSKAAAVFATLGIPEFPVMRPPYELWDDTTAVAATTQGLQAVILWNIDTRDWQGANKATIQRVALNGGKGSIILMHTCPEATAAALPAIIKGFKARGFRFVTIGEMLGIPGPVPYPAPAGT
jgi:peptidoglycan/xylan/chitin deacetylase (PgdA/CDA1 family)